MNPFERLEEWLYQQGASLDQLELKAYDDPNGNNSDNNKATTLEQEQMAILNYAEEKKEASLPSRWNITTSSATGSHGTTSCSTSRDCSNSSSHGNPSNHNQNSNSNSNSNHQNQTSNNDNETHSDSEMRGVHAKNNIPPHTTIVSIPRKCLITVEMGQATPIGQAILNADLELDAPKHIFLMVYLLWDRYQSQKRQTTSFFQPYYDVLPKTLRNMPIFWTEQELQGLQGSHLLTQIQERKEAIQEDYEAICAACPQLAEICTLHEFQWARMCVCSRNFGLTIDGRRTSALVPYSDMLNHYRPRETKWTFDEHKQAFTITTLQHALQAGAQVYDSYGQKCNHRFLLNYGFAVEDNRELDGFCPNECPIALTVEKTSTTGNMDAGEDTFYAKMVEFWNRGDVLPHMHNRYAAEDYSDHPDNDPKQPVLKRIRVCVSNNENTRLLFSYLRVLACNPSELEYLTVGASPKPSASRSPMSFLTSSYQQHQHYQSCRDIRHPISIRNEMSAMKLLLRVVDRHLRAYPTCLSRDVEDLSDETRFPKFSNARHAKIQVRGEKEVLHHFAEWARVALQILQVLEEEVRGEEGGVEVPLNSGDPWTVSLTPSPSFDSLVRQMEETEDVHHTIVRYCSDVLSSLRRQELLRQTR